MDYVKTAVMFSSKGVNSTLVAWNKVILLHGPPGRHKLFNNFKLNDFIFLKMYMIFHVIDLQELEKPVFVRHLPKRL